MRLELRKLLLEYISNSLFLFDKQQFVFNCYRDGLIWVLDVVNKGRWSENGYDRQTMRDDQKATCTPDKL